MVNREPRRYLGAVRVKIGKTIFELVEGDIADQDTDAVVTAAHWKLHGGDGTDGAVHSKGGPRIMEECRRIGGCAIGSAVITGGGNLKARHVIHAVGPVYQNGDERDILLLASAYKSSLKLASANGLKSISFPSLSTGAFGYPMREAAPIAIKVIANFLKEGKHDLVLVRFVLFPYDDAKALSIYEDALHDYLSA